MTDLPAEAVEAVEAVLTDAGVDLYDNVHDLARLALTAAAPLIAAQAAKHERERTAIAIARLIRARANATLDDRERLSGNISAGYALVFAGIWHKNALLSDDPVAAECDHLRAGIEALRDEWRASEATVLIEDDGSHRTVYRAISYEKAATALAALLPERAR